MKACYDARAPEYGDWYYGESQFAGRERLGRREELAAPGVARGRWFVTVAS